MHKFDFKKITSEHKTLIGAFILHAIIIILFFIFQHLRISSLYREINSLTDHLAAVEASFASTTNDIKTTIQTNQASLAATLNAQTRDVGIIEQKLQQQVGSVSNTVSTLQKLSKTDPELLAKYSKVFFLNENYAPPRVTEIPTGYRYSNTKAVSIHTDVWPHLQSMIDAARKSGVNIFVSSAYRSFDEQKALKGDYTITYGAGTANQFSADQGYSEHQLGTAVDFTTTSLAGQLDGFEATPAYNWLLSNAYKYGFVISYPKDNKFYVFEPWHWRYVGVKLAIYLHSEGKNFYDLDQRKIDEYLVSVFE
jgi:LAS superfamily LD-carboxypeptidase LdcB